LPLKALLSINYWIFKRFVKKVLVIAYNPPGAAQRKPDALLAHTHLP